MGDGKEKIKDYIYGRLESKNSSRFEPSYSER